jgi:hypothetical protein
MTLKGPEDKSYEGTLTRLARVFWSRQRCHHGDKVVVSVRTENIADDAALKLQVYTEDHAKLIDEIGGLSIKGSALDREYEIQWKEKGVPADARRFVVRALIEPGPLESAWSPALYVDLQPPAFSV